MFVTGLLVAAACLPLTPVQAVSNKTLTVLIPDVPSSSQNIIQDNFLGISWELSPVDYLWGKSVDTLSNAMKNYLHNIHARMSNSLRIRVGGNGMDSSTYVPSQKQMIVLTDPNAYYNDMPCDFGPVFFDVFNAMADAVGEMEFIIGLSMQNPSKDTDMLELAAAARSKFGKRLDAMLLGNEPDLYAGHGTRKNYTIQDYIPEVTEVLNDMGDLAYDNFTNTTLIGGPTICCSWVLADVLNAGLTSLPYKYYTIQHYPTYVCNGVNAKTSNISYYISHTNVQSFVNWNDAGVQLAKKNNVPMLLTEYNSASCGGDPTVAPTFAAALWAVDAALQAASYAFAGVYLHTREIGKVYYNLFQPPSKDNYLSPDWTTGAVYYAELVVAEALLSNSSIVVDLNIDNSLTSPSASVAAYAVYDGASARQALSRLVLFNFDYPRSSSDSSNAHVAQTFVLPGNISSPIAIRYLLASNITEKTAITWAGQTVGTNGALQGEQQLQIMNCSGPCSIEVPGPGLAVVWLNATSSGQLNAIYSGNSTIAGVNQVNNKAKTSGSARYSFFKGTTLLRIILLVYGSIVLL